MSAALTLADRLWVSPPRLDKAENVEHDFFLALGLELFGLTGRKKEKGRVELGGLIVVGRWKQKGRGRGIKHFDLDWAGEITDLG